MNRRVHLGRDLRALDETVEGVRLEGSTRLRPGHLIEIANESSSNPSASPARLAIVETWAVVRLGRDGPTYGGLCRWR